jgi:hypothetical protein
MSHHTAQAAAEDREPEKYPPPPPDEAKPTWAEPIRAADEAASEVHDYIWSKNGLTLEQANDAIWTIHNVLRPLIAAEGAALPAALDEAIGLLDEIYAHVGPNGSHLDGPEVKIWVHRATIDRLGDWLASHRAAYTAQRSNPQP